MIDWFQDPRAEQGELASREAERSERRGQHAAARALYREAAEAYASVAASVPADCPNMRSDLAIAAVACFARGGALVEAVALARRMLDHGDALSTWGKAELARMAHDYAEPESEDLPRIGAAAVERAAHKG